MIQTFHVIFMGNRPYNSANITFYCIIIFISEVALQVFVLVGLPKSYLRVVFFVEGTVIKISHTC